MADKKRPVNKKSGKAVHSSKKIASASRPVKAGKQASDSPKTSSQSRKKADALERYEEALHDSESIFREFVFAQPDPIEVLALDGTILMCNEASAAAYGSATAERTGQNAFDGIPPEVAKERRGLLDRVKTTKQKLWINECVRGRFYETMLSPIVDHTGEVGKVAVFPHDVTERKQAENALRESEDKFSKSFQKAPLLITLSEIETGTLLEVNDKFLELSGFTRDEVIGRTVVEIGWIPEEQRSRLRRSFLEHGRVAGMELTLRSKDGRDINCLYNGEAIMVSGIPRLLSIAQDITERKKIEDTRMFLVECGTKGDDFFESLANYLAVSLGMDYVCIDRLEGDLLTARTVAVYFDGKFEDNVSYMLHDTPCGEVVGKDVCCFPEGVRHRFPKDSVLQDMKAESYIGVTLWSHTHQPIGLIAVIGRRPLKDRVSAESVMKLAAIRAAAELERKLAEEQLRQSERFIRGILDTVDEGFIVIDEDFRILTANKAYCDQVARPCDDIIGMHCFEISHNIKRPCYEEGEECAVRRVFETGKSHTALHMHGDREGHVLYVETKGFPIKDAEGNVTSVIETINNITEKHLLEEERLKSQKLESIGTLAGGIAHDFNNLLQGIFGYISMAKMTLDQKEKSLAMLEQAEKALHQSVNLTTQLLTFSKGGKPVKKRIFLAAMIRNAATFALSGSRSTCVLDIAPGLWQAEADEGQLGQVIQNIVLNADQAMPIGGTVRVTATNMAEGDAALPSGLAKVDYVVIAIEDTGVGIPEQYLSKIFDPYFTTKEKGSGLGLATSYSIVRNHGGLIDVRTKSGEGTTFMLYLPAIAGEVRITSAVGSVEPSLPRRARILVMDDEEIIRSLSSDLLGALGHEVEVAKHGREALEKYQGATASGRPFDIVILDLTIRGGMGGLETMQKLLELDPAVKAIVSSGYSEDAATADYEKQGFKAFLKKPYDVDTLSEVLNKMLTS